MTEIVAPQKPHLILNRARQRSFVAFLMKAWPEVTGGELISWNWHLDAIAHQLERVAGGDTRRLIVNLPPRNGKSKLISIIWAAFMLGQDPTLNFVCVSYSNELSSKLARDCLSIMQSNWYQKLFPATKISRKRSANWDFETTRGGGRLATSVTGTLTGRGGDIIILDDVIKPDEAMSEVARNNVNNWFQSTLSSRLNDKGSGAILCVMQRLHEFDLTGMLLEAGGWNHLSLPAIATEDATIPLTRGKQHKRKSGEVLHPEREPLSTLDELKVAMGSPAFNAQYQQDPIPAQGNIFQASWLQYYDPDTFDEYGEVIQSWDTAIKTGPTNDWSVCVTATVFQKNVYITHIWRGRLEFPELQKKAVELAQRHGAKTILIEDKASGSQLLQALKTEHQARIPTPLGRTPEADKVTRAAGVSSILEAGEVYLPNEASWLDAFVKELLAFPNSKFDDQVDALTQLLERVRQQWSYHQPDLVGPEAPDPLDYSDNDYSDDVDPWGAY
ncbi:phage terminase large subunit [Erythrobacter crassostreae]|uniref:Phage terminase large subunit n=1 Tax=Erythrobacter crassostreae TaxID=2828328 RepID=A0A9X1F3G4_9SPHN|nr:phage terminase large subunit [Erythrobacter crassostrea]MBV7259009.1 phage terminase large subunit [Erythrobacter crassostrea]